MRDGHSEDQGNGLSGAGVGKLVNLVRDSFRVRRNRAPIYVDVAGNLERIAAPQHQVVFGRRGSGKSCLLVHYLAHAQGDGVLPIYILADEYKRLTYPDVLIRILVDILNGVRPRRAFPCRMLDRHCRQIGRQVVALRRLLDVAEEADVTLQRGKRRSRTARGAAPSVMGAAVEVSGESTESRTSSYREQKVDVLERHLRDYKTVLQDAMANRRQKPRCGAHRRLLLASA